MGLKRLAKPADNCTDCGDPILFPEDEVRCHVCGALLHRECECPLCDDDSDLDDGTADWIDDEDDEDE